jgi:signal transduction histidine kinase
MSVPAGSGPVKRGWWRDTLFMRLFVLMWVALVVSHLVAYLLVTRGLPSFGGTHGDGFSPRLPTFPSLPPTPGLPDSGRPAAGTGPGPGAGAGPGPGPGLGPGTGPGPRAQGGGPPGVGPPPGAGFGPLPRTGPGQDAGGPPGLPTPLLLLDYGVRLLIIGAAAWLGARWLSQPMRRLVQASRTLGAALGRGPDLPRLDESRGTVEVREAAHVFNRMAHELREQFQSRELLMAALSHDLRTPLTRMRMRLEAHTDEPVAQRCIADIRDMDQLIEAALEIFRNAHAPEPAQPTDLHALVQSLVDDLVEQGQAATLAGAPVVVPAQPVATRRIVTNLLGNALRYGTRADVTVRVDGPWACVVIEDDGPGIPEEQLDAVFRPFYRVDSSRSRETGGMGLGLYIVRDLTQRQGGRLSLRNRPQGGLRAEIRLPK